MFLKNLRVFYKWSFCYVFEILLWFLVGDFVYEDGVGVGFGVLWIRDFFDNRERELMLYIGREF